MQTFWSKTYSLANANTEWKDPKYYELIMQKDNTNYNDYWLSSRFTNIGALACSFGLQTIKESQVFLGGGSQSAGESFYNTYALRPIVTIPASSCTIQAPDEGSTTYKISPKV